MGGAEVVRSPSMRLVALVIAVASLAPIADAQTGDVVVAADEGSKLRPIARFDGREWRQTCDVSGVAAAATRPGDPPKIVASRGVRVDPIRQVKVGTPERAGLEPDILRLF